MRIAGGAFPMSVKGFGGAGQPWSLGSMSVTTTK